MHPNVDRVADAARQSGLEISVERFPEGTRTAEDAARAVGCDVAQIVKSLVFMAGDDAVLALVSGANRVDLARLAAALDVPSVRRATADEAHAATGFAIGGVPPFGHATRIQVAMDADLNRHAVVWAAAGLPDAVFAIDPAALAQVSGARVADLAEGMPNPAAPA